MRLEIGVEPLRLLHFLSASVLLGTRFGGAYLLWRADRSGRVAAVARVATSVAWAELVLTSPAVVVQLATGLALMESQGLSLSVPWLATSLALFVAVGLVWAVIVLLQFRIAAMAESAHATGSHLPSEYSRMMAAWHTLEWPVFVAVLALFALMVFRVPAS